MTSPLAKTHVSRKTIRLGDVLERVSNPVTVDPTAQYREIGIRSHGHGLFHKPVVNGKTIGEKRVFYVEPGCLVLNIVFAWEQAVARTTEEERGFIASHRFPMYQSKGEIDIDYLFWYFKTPQGKRALYLASPGGAGRNKTLNQQDFEDIRISVPPLAEQRRIADIFETWDRAVQQTEQLASARRKKFNWLYKQVFPKTGTNLPSGWRAEPITNVAKVRFSGVDKKSVEGEQSVFLCNYTDVFYNRRITADMTFMSATATERQVEKFSLQVGDVVFTKDSETAEEIGVSSVIVENLPNLVCGYHLGVARARPSTITGEFLALAMRHPWVREEFRKAANGVTRFGLNLDVMDQVHILFPCLELQKEIVSALSTVEAEIELLTRSLKLLQLQKKALMQCLLSDMSATLSKAAAE